MPETGGRSRQTAQRPFFLLPQGAAGHPADSREARASLKAAAVCADELDEDRTDLGTVFGPTNVTIHRVAVAIELGYAREAVQRIPDVNALRRLATLTGGLTEPWLICGDFNTAASSWPGGDRAVVVSPAKLTYPADEPAEPIDYCVASAAFRLDADVLPGAASDHLPLLISARQTR